MEKSTSEARPASVTWELSEAEWQAAVALWLAQPPRGIVVPEGASYWIRNWSTGHPDGETIAVNYDCEAPESASRCKTPGKIV